MAVRRLQSIIRLCSSLFGGLAGGAGVRSIACEERRAGRTALPRSSGAEELEPVAVPEPSELALEFYRSSNWLWMLNVAVGRDASRRAGVFRIFGAAAEPGSKAGANAGSSRSACTWSMYLAIVFLIDLPLSYYEGYVRLHAYGLSNQTLGNGSAIRSSALAISMVVGFAAGLGSVFAACSQPEAMVAVYDDPFGSVPVRGHVDQTDLDRSAIQPIRADERPGSRAKDPALARRAGIDGSRVFEVEKSVDTKAVNAYVTGVFATKRIVLWDTLLAKLDDEGSAACDGPRNGPLRAGARGAFDRSVVGAHASRALPG